MVLKKRVVIVVAGQPSSNPRTVKEYQAFKDAGYEVRVLYGFWADWASRMDAEMFQKGVLDKRDFILVGGSPTDGKWTYFYSRLFYRAVCMLGRLNIAPFRDWCLSRSSFFLIRAAKRQPADLYSAHNLGALPAAVKASSKAKAPCSFDAEDFHRGDLKEPVDDWYGLTTLVEEKYIPQCSYLTAAAPLIARAYEQAISLMPMTVINNVFSRTFLQPVPEKSEGVLRLFWFSQSIGPDRGLELVISALKLLPEYTIELHLLGLSTETYRNELRGQALRGADIHFLDPVAPEAIFSIAAQFDIGMAAEVPHCENRNICLTNKLFTYLLAGNCILASDTLAQREFLSAYPGIGLVYDHGSATDLAAKLSCLYNDRSQLLDHRKKALTLAAGSMNWETESKKLLQLAASVIATS